MPSPADAPHGADLRHGAHARPRPTGCGTAASGRATSGAAQRSAAQRSVEELVDLEHLAREARASEVRPRVVHGRPRLWRPGHCEGPRRLSRFRCRAVQRGRAAAACGACGLLPAASKLARGERQWPGRAAVGGCNVKETGEKPLLLPRHGIAMPCQHAARCSPSAPLPFPWRGGRRLHIQGKARCYEKQRTPRSRSAHATQRTALPAREAMRCAAAESPARRVTWRGLVDQLLEQIGACGAQPTGREPCEPVDCLAPQHARRCLVRACRSA